MSPPPTYNFELIPVVEGRTPLWDAGETLPMMSGLRTAGITLDRKSLAELAVTSPKAFASLVQQAKTAAARA